MGLFGLRRDDFLETTCQQPDSFSKGIIKNMEPEGIVGDERQWTLPKVEDV